MVLQLSVSPLIMFFFLPLCFLFILLKQQQCTSGRKQSSRFSRLIVKALFGLPFYWTDLEDINLPTLKKSLFFLAKIANHSYLGAMLGICSKTHMMIYSRNVRSTQVVGEGNAASLSSVLPAVFPIHIGLTDGLFQAEIILIQGVIGTLLAKSLVQTDSWNMENWGTCLLCLCFLYSTGFYSAI